MPGWFANLAALWQQGRSVLRPGSPREPDWRRYTPLVEQIRRRQACFLKQEQALLNRQGRGLRKRGQFVERMIDAMAIACVTARRMPGTEPFDVQIVGALVMHDGNITEMQTGEGKALAPGPHRVYQRAGWNGCSWVDRERLSGSTRYSMDASHLQSLLLGVHPAPGDRQVRCLHKQSFSGDWKGKAVLEVGDDRLNVQLTSRRGPLLMLAPAPGNGPLLMEPRKVSTSICLVPGSDPAAPAVSCATLPYSISLGLRCPTLKECGPFFPSWPGYPL